MYINCPSLAVLNDSDLLIGRVGGEQQHLAESCEQLGDIRFCNYPVDSLKSQRRRMKVHDLNKRISCRMIRKILAGICSFKLLVELLCSRKTVVAVTHCIYKGAVLIQRILLVECVKITQSFKSCNSCICLLIADKPALDTSAALHKVKIIKLFKAVLSLSDLLYYSTLRIVNEYHYMRKLNRCAVADLYSRRYTLNYRGLGSPYLRCRTLAVIVLFKVDLADKSCPHKPVRLHSLDIYERVLVFSENTVIQIFLHISVDVFNALVNILVLKIHLGQDQPQRRCSVPCYLVSLRPVFRLAGVLVAGDYRPFLHVRIFRQKYVRL